VKVKTHKAFVRRNVFFTTVSVNQNLTDILIAANFPISRFRSFLSWHDYWWGQIGQFVKSTDLEKIFFF